MVSRGTILAEFGGARRTARRSLFSFPRIYRADSLNPGGGGGGVRLTNAARIQQESGVVFWYDNIPAKIEDLQRMIDQDLISGVTTNPAILATAIKNGVLDEIVNPLCLKGILTKEEIAYAVNAQGIFELAKVLLPVYEKTKGKTGFASIEVDPRLANEIDPQVKQGLELFRQISLPNIMIKIPATEAGVVAVRKLTAEEVNVNATLIFSRKHYLNVVEAYFFGLLDASKTGKNLLAIHSVASFFVSRFDTEIDKRLENNAELQGVAAVAMSKEINRLYRQIFFGEASDNGRIKGLQQCWKDLQAKGANVQTLLLASTSVKNPNYPAHKYVLDILGPDTINTLPPPTLAVLREFNGEVPATLSMNVDKATDQLKRLLDLGIDVDRVGQQLQDEGVGLFVAPYEGLLAAIEAKIK